MSGQSDISGAFQRPTIVDYLIVAEVQELSLTLNLYIGALAVGVIGISGGRVVYAEIPGAQGDTALSLLTRLPNARVMPEPWTARITNIQRPWRELVGESMWAQSPGRSRRVVQIRAELRELETESSQDQAPARAAEPSNATASAQRVATELLDWASITAYLRGDLDQARRTLACREQLSPCELMCAANLERLRLRLLEDEIAETVSEVSV